MIGEIKYVLYQASVIFTIYCHHPAVLGDLLMANPLYIDVYDIFEITERLPFLKRNEKRANYAEQDEARPSIFVLKLGSTVIFWEG